MTGIRTYYDPMIAQAGVRIVQLNLIQNLIPETCEIRSCPAFSDARILPNPTT